MGGCGIFQVKDSSGYNDKSWVWDGEKQTGVDWVLE